MPEADYSPSLILPEHDNNKSYIEKLGQLTFKPKHLCKLIIHWGEVEWLREKSIITRIHNEFIFAVF